VSLIALWLALWMSEAELEEQGVLTHAEVLTNFRSFAFCW
jgi:hypothetical protein